MSDTRSLLSAARCPLCRGLFRDPVSIPCGHNFCRACIEHRARSRGSFACPRCGDAAPRPSLRPNRELAALLAALLRPPARGDPAARCPPHGESPELPCDTERGPGHRERALHCEGPEPPCGTERGPGHRERALHCERPELPCDTERGPERNRERALPCEGAELPCDTERGPGHRERALPCEGPEPPCDTERGPERNRERALPCEGAARDGKEELQAQARAPRDRRGRMEGPKAAEEGKSRDWLERGAAERERLRAGLRELRELRELRALLAGQERLLLGRLAGLRRRQRRRQRWDLRRSSSGRLSERSPARSRGLERGSERPPRELLQDSADIPGREEAQGDPEPAEAPPEPAEEPAGLPRKIAALGEMLQKFRASLTLDPDTAHPRLALSADLRRARWDPTRGAVPAHPKRFDSSRCVLAQQGFARGRHYWEVRVAPGAAWALGVARESVSRRGRLRARPERGVWAVGQSGGRCQALTSPGAPIALPEPPEVLGVLLDCDAGRVLFWEPRRARPVFAFPAATFGGERLLPLLCLGRGCELELC